MTTASASRSGARTRRPASDRPQLAALYGELARRTDSPVVELNRAAAIAEAGEVEAALALVESLELVHSDAERRFLERRLAELES